MKQKAYVARFPKTPAPVCFSIALDEVPRSADVTQRHNKIEGTESLDEEKKGGRLLRRVKRNGRKDGDKEALCFSTFEP